ncbi:MAG: glutathione S-transferase family protein [Sphingobium sp.]
MSSPDLLLHHYPVSPFSEKVRVVMGLKGLAWRACVQPVIMPKPDLITLTGGYRRIPILQIGADLYFDSHLIIEELERRFPERPAFLAGPATARATAAWIEGAFFFAAVGALFSGDWDFDDAFVQDRSALIGQPFDPAAMAQAIPASERIIRRDLALLSAQLGDGRPFLTGDRADAVDAIVFAQILFLRWGKGRTARLIDEWPALAAWEDRIARIGHGRQGPDASRADAIAIARADAQPVKAGDPVRFRYAGANSAVLEGRLLHVDDDRLSIVRTGDDGLTVRLHMPRSAGEMVA